MAVSLSPAHVAPVSRLAAAAFLLVTLASPAAGDITVYKWSFSVPEDAPIGTIVGRLTPMTPNPKLINTAGVSVPLPFTITTNGNLTTSQLLDRTVTSSYELIVVLSNGALHQVTVDVLDVNNHPPVFAVPVINVTIAESAAVGSQIMQLQSAVDPDFGINSTQGYRIVAGNVGGAFAVDVLRAGATSVFAVLRVNRTLDYQQQSIYQLVVQAYDGHGLTGNLTINVRVTSVNDALPVFDHATYSAALLDNATFGYVVLRVRAVDPELGNLSTVTYTVNAALSDPNQPFFMDRTTGQLLVWQPLSVPADLPSVAYALQIDATIGDPSLGRTASCAAVVNVIDGVRSAPQIEVVPLLISVPEDISIADPIAHVSISDPNGNAGNDAVSIVTGNEAGAFQLLPVPNVSGQYQLFATAALAASPRARGLLNLTLSAVSAAWPYLKAAAASVAFSVYQVNRNPPTFGTTSYVVFLAEGSPRGTKLALNAKAYDADLGTSGAVTYSLAPVPGRHSNWFTVNASTGVVSVAVEATVVDCETDSQPSFALVASDGGIPQLSSNVTVVVNIINANDVVPTFVQNVFNISVPENQPTGTCFFQLNATDGDCGWSNLSFALITPTGGGSSYDLNVTGTGRVCIARSLDFERQQHYVFSVRVTDSGGLYSTATVAVKVTDINDNSPVFYPAFYMANVNNQLAAGSLVVSVNATDADSGAFGSVSYELLSTGGTGHFKLNASTGAITLSQSLAGQVPPQTFYLAVRATDGGGRTSVANANVTIILVGLTSLPPQFTSARYSFNVSEAAAVHTFVGAVRATAGNGSTVAYSIASGDPNGWFQMNSTTGYLYTTAAKLDYEQASAVSLVVQAASGTPPIFALALVSVTIDDVNDNPPSFLEPTVYLSIRENFPNGTELYTVHAYDPDRGANGTVRYRLILNEDGVLAIDRDTGILTLQILLDYERKRQYNVTVQAYDLGVPVNRTADQHIVLWVTDVNDNAPLFGCIFYEFVANESFAIGSIVGRVNASDLDEGRSGNVTYSLATNSTLFGIDPSLGTVYITAMLDHELQREYSLIAIATDGGWPTLSSSSAIVIRVLDANDNPPAFLVQAYKFFIAENVAAGTVVGTVSAVDPDLGENGVVLYTLVSATTAFTINATTGVIFTTSVLDRELNMLHSLVVEAADNGLAVMTSTATITIAVLDVNDHAPVFPWLASADAYVSENMSAGTKVGAFTAFDPDLGVNGTIIYSLTAGDTANFTVNPQTGWISTASVFDREVKDTYWVTLLASDRGTPPKNSSIMVVIRILDVNELPQFRTATINFTVTENIPVGTTIGNVTAYDYDVGSNAVIYYFVSSSSEGNVFDVDSQTGAIVTVDTVDYEHAHSHWMTVVARDSGYLQQLSTTVNVTVAVLDVNDNRPVFMRDPSLFYVIENEQPGYVVGVITAMDADSGVNGDFLYSITNSSSQIDDTWRYLTVEPLTGRIVTVAPIDCEATQVLFVVVQAEDQAVDPSQRLAATNTLVVIVVNENDNAPVFLTPSHVALLEDEPVGFPVMAIVAADGDFNDVLRYTILSGNEDEKFELDSLSGVLTLRSPLDRETTAAYVLNISATDNGYPPQSTIQVLSIDVVDVNDNPPLFAHSTYTANVTEGGPANGTVTQLVATDADTGINAQLMYIIPNGTASSMFSVDNNGVIVTTASLDRENCSSYVFTAYVRDSAYPALYDQTTVLINVTDINDNAPEFAAVEFQLHVAENMPGSTSIWQLVAYDGDEGLNGQVYYNITGGNDGNVFSIDRTTGIIRSLALDREAVSSYYVEITVTDLGVPPLSNVTYLNVTVDDANDNNPNFTQMGSYRISFPEDTARGTLLLTVFATDRDIGDNARLVYYLDGLAANDSGYSCPDCDGKFAISVDNGTIYTIGLFDREKKSSYMFYVKVSDSAQYGPRLDQRLVEVTILDVNDNAPIFATNPMIANVSSVTTVVYQTVLYPVRASDKDTGPNGMVEYQLLNVTGGGSFSIGRTTGDLVATASLTGLPVVQRIRVRATDRGSPPKYSDGLIELRIDSTVSSSLLRFPNTTYSVYLDENTPVGQLVITVKATVTGMPTAIVVYSLTGDATSDSQPFAITSTTGEIRVSDSSLLDYEVVQRFRLVVIALVDPGSGSGVFTDYCTVFVTLRDVNDNAPIFTLDRYTARVWEELPADTYVTKVTARDADDGINGQVDYSILNPTVYPANMFNLISPSGIVSTTGPLDREQLEVIRITVVAIDRGDPKLSTTCTLRVTVVDVNDNWPTIINANRTVNVSESLEVGKPVLILIGQDPDLSSTLSYGFQHGTAAGNPFNIDSMSGLVTLARSLDRETDSSYVRMVYVDDTKHTSLANITVNVLDVNDNAPVFEKLSYETSVLEDTPIGTPLVQVVARDADEGANGAVTYSLQGTEGVVDRFVVDPVTGWIATRRVVAYSAQEPVAQLVVTATDGGEPPLSSVVFVRVTVMDINNYAPQFSLTQYIAHVSEDARRLTVISRLQAEDKDDSPENKKVDYMIVGGNPDVFELAMNTGELSLVGALDREAVQQYKLVIMAADRGAPPKNSTVTVLIIVDDANDNSPAFNRTEYVVTVPESVPAGSYILQVQATDSDIGGNGMVEYMIVSGNDDNLFNMNAATGEISLNPGKELDYERRTEHRMAVRAMDNGLPRQSAVVGVVINVTDVNDYGPQFERLMYLETVKENYPVGSEVFRAYARDLDSGVFGLVAYSLVGANDHFQIDPSSGVVTTAVVFDYEAVQKYRFNVTATDKGGRQAVIQVSVQVLDQDEYRPVFEQTKYVFSVPFTADVGTVLGQVSATDKDQGDEGRVMYTLKDPNWYFSVELETGKIMVAHKLNEPDGSSTTSAVASSGSSSKAKRSSDGNSSGIVPKNEALVIIASTGQPDSLFDNTVVQIQVDGYPDQVTSQAAATAPGLTGISLGLIIGFAVIAIVLLIVIIVLWMRGRRRKQHSNGGHAPPGTLSAATDISMVADNIGSYLPPYTDYRLADHASNTRPSPTHTDSSGRGSTGLREEDDEEIRAINSYPQPPAAQSAVARNKTMPDSGIQQDDDTASLQSAKDHHEYLARLGIDSTKLHAMPPDKKAESMRSVESMHHFSDEGGGEADSMDLGTNIYQKIVPPGGGGLGGVDLPAAAVASGTQLHFGTSIADASPATQGGGSLSSVTDSGEELTGSYNWDYLLDWGPQYQPLADVFAEIARLKDENVQPKRQPVKTVPVQHITSRLPSSSKMEPPPIITNIPPKTGPPLPMAAGLGRLESNQASARTSQLTSMASLPRSPISHESSFSNLALSPTFTPVLSPLATTRSPSVSTIHTTAGASERSTPRGSVPLRHQLAPLSQPVGAGAMTSSDAEFRI